jgi:hypothetical protein
MSSSFGPASVIRNVSSLMHMPRTKTLFFLAAGLLLVAAVWILNSYPAPIPALNSDGLRLVKLDGTPVVHRDMTEFYKFSTPAFIFLGCSICLFIWWLLRVFSTRRTS